jgi:hypothetical protein
MVKVAEATALSVIPDLIAIALMVVVELTLIGPE